jgi:DtxR family transcriptional regulator, Mn-dependent transcriptional regulator
VGQRVTNEGNEAVEDYAKAIYSLSRRGEGPVATSALAERLGVSPGAVSLMLKRLADDGLARYRPYHGAALTPAGERVALEVMRHHRLLESYLAEVLGMPWDRVHAEAEVLEHYISEELEELIAAALGDPGHDPHGDPIPDAELVIHEEETGTLAELGAGRRATLVRVSDSDPRMLRHLSGLGIGPGDELELLGREPFAGPLRVRAGGREHALGPELAAAMQVRPLEGGREP